MKTLDSRVRRALEGLLVYLWLTNLAGTDSYYSVYVLCAVLGLFCMSRTSAQRSGVSARARLGCLAAGGLFSAAVVLANDPLFEPLTALLSLFDLVCTFLGGTVLASRVLLYALERLPNSRPGRCASGRVFAMVFCVVSAVDLAYLLGAAYPGVLTTDSVSTMVQILEGVYNNTMPFWHTMTVRLFYRLGFLLFGEINAAVAFFHAIQILFLAACMAYAVSTMYRAGVPGVYLAGVSAVYMLLPYNIAYSVTMWKDVLFGGAVLLFVTALYRLLRKMGPAPVHMGCLIVGGVGVCLWRTNGWFAFVAATLVLCLALGGKQRRLARALLVVALVCWVLLNPVLWALDVEGTDLVEALAVPFQQLARVVASGAELTGREEALLSRAFYLEELAELYDPGTVDPVKFLALRRDQLDAVKADWTQYLRLYLELGLRYPGEYLRAWVELTKGYWNGGYDYWIYNASGIAENDLGLVCTGGGGLIARAFAAWFRYLEKPAVLQPLYSIGLHAWAVVACLVVNVLNRRREWLLCVVPVVLLAGLWLGTPVYAEFRYAYPIFLTAPLILGATLFEPGKA